jgi:hypothetical protein
MSSVAAVAQRGQLNREHVQTVEQILAEQILCDQLNVEHTCEGVEQPLEHLEIGGARSVTLGPLRFVGCR